MQVSSRRNFLLGALGVGSMSLFNGCSKPGLTTYHDIPVPEHTGRRVAAEEIYHRMPKVGYDNTDLLDKVYAELTMDYIDRYIQFFKDFVFYNTNMDASVWRELNGKNDDGNDCDNFGILFKAMAATAAWQNQRGIDIALGYMSVRQQHSFGGVGSGGNHLLNFAFVEGDIIVIEPQTGFKQLLNLYINPIYRYTI